MLLRILTVLLTIIMVTGVDAARVTITSPVSVKSGAMITLGEMASITDAGKAEVEKLAAVPVTYAPIAGSTKKIDLPYLKMRLKAVLGDISKLKLQSPDTVLLAGRSASVKGTEIAAAAREYVLAQAPQDGKRYEVEVTRTPADVVIPEGELEMKMATSSTRYTTGPRCTSVDLCVDGKQCAHINVYLDVKAFAEVLVAGTVISRKAPLCESNTKWETRDVSRVSSPVTKDSDISTAMAARSINAGVVITTDMITTPPAIETGSSVMIIVKSNNLKLSARGTAMQSGKPGDTILVKSPSGASQLRAVVVEPGIVEVRI